LQYKHLMAALLIAVLACGCGCSMLEGVIYGESRISASPGETVTITGTFELEQRFWTDAGLSLDTPLYFWLYANSASKIARCEIGHTAYTTTPISWSWTYTVPTSSSISSTWSHTENWPFGGCTYSKNVYTRIGGGTCSDCNTLPDIYGRQQFTHKIMVDMPCPDSNPPPQDPATNAYITVYADPYLKARVIYSYQTGAKSFSEITAGYTSSTGYTLTIPSANFDGPGDRASVSVRLVASGYTGSGGIEISEGQSADLIIPLTVETTPTTTTTTTTAAPTTTSTTAGADVTQTTTTTAIPCPGLPIAIIGILLVVWRLRRCGG